MRRVPRQQVGGVWGPALPDGYTGGYRLTSDDDYELTDYDHAAVLQSELDALAASAALPLPGGPSVSVHFDDGYLGQYNALSMMHDEFDAHGTVYMTANRIDHATNGITAAQLVELEEMGHEIGTHSFDHANLTTLTEPQLVTDFRDTRAALTAAGVQRVGGHAYPYGASNDLVESVARRFEPYARQAVSFNSDLDGWVTGQTRERFVAGGMQADAIRSTAAFREQMRRATEAAVRRGVHLPLYMHDMDTGQIDGLRQMLRMWRSMGVRCVPLRTAHVGWNRAREPFDWSMDSLDEWTVTGTSSRYSYSMAAEEWFAGQNQTALKVTPTEVTASSHNVFLRASGQHGLVAVTPGETVNIAYWRNIPTALTRTWGGGGSGLRLMGYPMGSDSPSVQEQVLANEVGPTSGWERRQVAWTVPDGVYRISVQLRWEGVTAGTTYVGMVSVTNAEQDVELAP